MSLKGLLKKMNRIAKTNQVEVFVATSMLATTADRIFTQGKDASNSAIGEYSDGYMKQRKRMNYPSTNKVILQATRQMANDWSVISTGKSLGLGFKNSENANKSEYVESTYKKDIFKHTDQELQEVDLLIGKKIKQLLNG
jgi:hypothetical protein